MARASPVLLRMLVTCLLAHVDVRVREGALFCDALCDQGPLIGGQVTCRFCQPVRSSFVVVPLGSKISDV